MKRNKKQTPINRFNGIKHGGTFIMEAKKEEKRNDPVQIMASIVRQQRSLFSKDMDDWITARMQAEQPYYPVRQRLYNIYLDLELDGFIHGLIYNHRITPIKNKKFKIFNANKKANDDKTALFKKGWVKQTIKYAMESILWGHSLVYLNKLLYDGKTSWIKEIELIDRKHVHPEAHIIAAFETDIEGIDYTAEPVANYVIPVGESRNLGLYNKLVPLWILKRHSWQSWDQFEEMFGIPIRIAKTASQDPRVQAEMEKWLDEMGSAGYGIFPENTELDIKESKHTDAFKVFDEKRQAANEEMAIAVVGQTMTSMDGSSRSQGEVHERVQAEIIQDDEDFIATLFTEVIIPLLRDKHGWPLDEGDYWEFEQPKDKVQLLAIFTGVYQMGFELDPVQVSEEFGVNIIGKRQATTPAPPNQQSTDEENEDPDAPDDDDDEDEGKPTPGKDAKALLDMHRRITAQIGGKHVR